MGTRSLTIIRDAEFSKRGKPKALVTIYRQFDGYPSGLGAELQKFLTPFTVVNGYGSDAKFGQTANGAGCLAAQLIAHLKGDSVGNVYIYPAGTSDCGEEYVYTITVKVGAIDLKCEKAGWKETGDFVGGKWVTRATPIKHPPVTLYDGPVAGFDAEAIEKKREAA
jgi:hypothetical protein